MDFPVMEWTNLILRWIHVFAGILWVGTTYFFTWLDGELHREELSVGASGKAQVWLVHSGGFYVVEKQKQLTALEQRLHWFKWEAAITWLSGILLLGVVYHAGGLMVDKDVADIPNGAAIGMAMTLVIVAWPIYDLLLQKVFEKSETAGTIVGYLLVVAATYFLFHKVSARAAYMHIGTMFGTLMTANVWMRILPAQRKMIAAAKGGAALDPALGARAKLRSKQNTFMVVPVVFIMISSHFPIATYGNTYGWQILCALILVGWGAAKVMRSA